MAAKTQGPTLNGAARVDEAKKWLVKLIDTFDNFQFGGEYPVNFGDMRQLINYADRALDALDADDAGA